MDDKIKFFSKHRLGMHTRGILNTKSAVIYYSLVNDLSCI